MRRIAVIMSLYKNDELRYVQPAIESILKQTYTEFTFYTMCDGPVRQDVRNYIMGLDDTRLCLYERERNYGLAHSLNELLSMILHEGTYEYIARMDADDISLPERFEKQIAFLESNEDVDCVGCWAIEIDSKGEEYYRKRMPITHEECLGFFKKRDCMIHPTVIFRRSFFEKAGLYAEDTYFGEDTMMWAQGFKNGCRFANLPEYLFKFRLDVNFFQRRRGWKHSKAIFKLRLRVNKMLHFGLKANIYAVLYAGVKIMPTKVLDIFYRTMR